MGQNSGQGNDIVPLTGLPASFLPTCSNGPELSFRFLHCLLTALGLRVKFSTVGLSPDESSDLTHFSLSLRLSVALASLSLRCSFCWNPFLQIFPCGSLASARRPLRPTALWLPGCRQLHTGHSTLCHLLYFPPKTICMFILLLLLELKLQGEETSSFDQLNALKTITVSYKSRCSELYAGSLGWPLPRHFGSLQVDTAGGDPVLQTDFCFCERWKKSMLLDKWTAAPESPGCRAGVLEGKTMWYWSLFLALWRTRKMKSVISRWVTGNKWFSEHLEVLNRWRQRGRKTQQALGPRKASQPTVSI